MWFTHLIQLIAFDCVIMVIVAFWVIELINWMIYGVCFTHNSVWLHSKCSSMKFFLDWTWLNLQPSLEQNYVVYNLFDAILSSIYIACWRSRSADSLLSLFESLSSHSFDTQHYLDYLKLTQKFVNHHEIHRSSCSICFDRKFIFKVFCSKFLF